MDVKIKLGSKYEDQSNWLNLYDKKKYLLIIQSIDLVETLNHKIYLVVVNGSLTIELQFKDPLVIF